MTRQTSILVGAAVALCLWAGLKPWTIAPDALDRIAGEALASDGSISAEAARLTFTALPIPRIDALAPRLSDAGGSLRLEAETLGGAVRLLPLLLGRLELADLSLIRARLLVMDRGEAMLHALAGKALRAAPGQSLFGLSRIVVVEGRVIAARMAGETAIMLDDLNAVLRKARLRDRLDARVNARWRGEAVEATLRDLDLGTYGEGEPAGFALTFGGRMVQGRLSGRVTRDAKGLPGQAEGVLEATLPSLPGVAQWLGLGLPFPAGETLHARADATLSASGLALTGGRFVLDDVVLAGVVGLRRGDDGALALAGTLAANALDMSGAQALAALTRGPDGGGSRDRPESDRPPRGDVDLRLSVGRLRIGPLAIGDAALALIAKGGRSDVTLGAGVFQGGTVKGRLTLAAPAQSALDFRCQLVIERIDAAGALAEWGATPRLSGTASGSLTLEGSGDSAATLIGALDGKVTLALRQGDIFGVNLPQILKRMEKSGTPPPVDARGGRTPFDTAILSGRVSRGVLEIAEGHLASPAMRVAYLGKVNLAERRLALNGTASLADNGGKDAPVLPFTVTGPFEDPTILASPRGAGQPAGEPPLPVPPAKAAAP